MTGTFNSIQTVRDVTIPLHEHTFRKILYNGDEFADDELRLGDPRLEREAKFLSMANGEPNRRVEGEEASRGEKVDGDDDDALLVDCS